jgi:hypothetical protein
VRGKWVLPVSDTRVMKSIHRNTKCNTKFSVNRRMETTTHLLRTEAERSDGETRVQWRTTVPKNLVGALDMEKGDTLVWGVRSGNTLTVTVNKDD